MGVRAQGLQVRLWTYICNWNPRDVLSVAQNGENDNPCKNGRSAVDEDDDVPIDHQVIPNRHETSESDDGPKTKTQCEEHLSGSVQPDEGVR